eukprot:1158747-Pelagomonas_calceolata.AAC.1
MSNKHAVVLSLPCDSKGRVLHIMNASWGHLAGSPNTRLTYLLCGQQGVPLVCSHERGRVRRTLWGGRQADGTPHQEAPLCFADQPTEHKAVTRNGRNGLKTTMIWMSYMHALKQTIDPCALSGLAKCTKMQKCTPTPVLLSLQLDTLLGRQGATK